MDRGSDPPDAEMVTRQLDLRLMRIGEVPAQRLGSLFEQLRQAGDERFFHPHPLTDDVARQLASYAGRDVYVVALAQEDIVAYGMLRGWDQGYDVPSLGVAVAPGWRGIGVGEWMMSALRTLAQDRGARCIRLTVSNDNIPARRLYERLGYRFTALSDSTQLGLLSLEPNDIAAQQAVSGH